MVHGKAERKCLECSTVLTGHNNSVRCKRCAARKRYVDRFGRPPERIIAKCGACDMEFSDYASNRKKKKSGVLFCSPECRAVWVGIQNSITRGGDGLLIPKTDKDKNYYRRNASVIREQRKQFYLDNREEILKNLKIASRERKKSVIEHYGGKCECCSESIIEFLTIDHVNNDGAEHRRKVGGGTKVYRDIIRSGFPEGRFRVLCFNCNTTRGFYGYCPHKPEERFEYSHVPHNPGRKRTVK